MNTTRSDTARERRKFIRHPVSVPLDIQTAYNSRTHPKRDEQHSTASRDVSSGVLLIHSDHPLPLGSNLTITFFDIPRLSFTFLPLLRRKYTEIVQFAKTENRKITVVQNRMRGIICHNLQHA